MNTKNKKDIKRHFNAIDLTNKRFGKLIAIRPTNDRNGSNIIWECKCDCGKTCYINTVNIKNSTKSCGCLRHQKLMSRVGKNNPNYKYGKEFRSKKSKLKANYNLTMSDYKKLLNSQNNVCVICKQPEKAKHSSGKVRSLSVDHNHKTGRVRGLLCTKCNFVFRCKQ